MRIQSAALQDETTFLFCEVSIDFFVVNVFSFLKEAAAPPVFSFSLELPHEVLLLLSYKAFDHAAQKPYVFYGF